MKNVNIKIIIVKPIGWDLKKNKITISNILRDTIFIIFK